MSAAPATRRNRGEDDLTTGLLAAFPSPDDSSCCPPPASISSMRKPTENTPKSHRRRFPGFAIFGECGRGGMGVVYVAEQLDLRRRVAVKFLHPELAVAQSHHPARRGEPRPLTASHPNIVQIFDSGTHHGRSFIVQEYVGGEICKRHCLVIRSPPTPRPAWSRHSREPSSMPMTIELSIAT